MGQAIAVRTDYTAGEVRRFAQRAKDAAQARRLLAIAAVLDGASREEAAKIGEPALPSCLPATPKLCSFTSMRSQPKSLRALTLFSSPIKPGGMAPRPSRFQTTFRSCSFRRAHPNSTPKKYLAIHAAELAVEPNFQILRRYRRPLLLRLEHTHRPALEDHVHRPTRLGSSRSLKLRIGITDDNHAVAPRAFASPARGRVTRRDALYLAMTYSPPPNVRSFERPRA